MGTQPTERGCALCGALTPQRALAEASWQAAGILTRLDLDGGPRPYWRRNDGACPACVQQALLQMLIDHGHEALHQGIQDVWPLDAEAAFGALPTPLRLHADPRFTGKGVTLALVDSAFYPHPDLVEPRNRIRAWADVAHGPTQARFFSPDEVPQWTGWDGGAPQQWHGLMTSTVAAGNGFLSHGLYRGLASDAELVLVQAMDDQGHVSNNSIIKALSWLAEEGPALGVRVVNLSLGGDRLHPLQGNPVDAAVAELVARGITVVVAAGNDGRRRLVPPATAPQALTIGGLDDQNTFDHEQMQIWHSNYGRTFGNARKPELVAPSIWVVAPLLPGTRTAAQAGEWFARRAAGDSSVQQPIADEKLVTPFYKHVDGTSFAAPLVSSVATCMLQANPALKPPQVREALIASARPIPGVPPARQGAGALDAGRAEAMALATA